MNLKEAKEYLNSQGYELLDEGFLDSIKDTFGATDWHKELKKRDNTGKVMNDLVSKLDLDPISKKASRFSENNILLDFRGKNDDYESVSLGLIRMLPVDVSGAAQQKKIDGEMIDKYLPKLATHYKVDEKEFEDKFYRMQKWCDDHKLTPILVKYTFCKGNSGNPYWTLIYPTEASFKQFMKKFVEQDLTQIESGFKDEELVNKNKKVITSL